MPMSVIRRRPGLPWPPLLSAALLAAGLFLLAWSA
jgi:hypothetical protein